MSRFRYCLRTCLLWCSMMFRAVRKCEGPLLSYLTWIQLDKYGKNCSLLPTTLFPVVHERAYIQNNLNPLSPLSHGSQVHFHSNSLSSSLALRMTLLYWGAGTQMLEGLLNRQFGEQSVTLSGAQHRQFSLGPLADGRSPVGSSLLRYCYFRDKKRPAGLKNMYLRSRLCHQSSCNSPYPYAW